MEIIATSSLMASEKDEGAEEKKSDTPESSWDTWKRGSIIGAAALTGGTLMAITGGMGTVGFTRMDIISSKKLC